jgi:hypothetical protein
VRTVIRVNFEPFLCPRNMGAMQRFLDNSLLLCRENIRGGKHEAPPFDVHGRPLKGYRYAFRGAVKQCRLCIHHRPLNVRHNGKGEKVYRGAFRCAVNDFHSSSGYVVVLRCDRWELAPEGPRKNRGQAWLNDDPIVARAEDIPR